MGRDFSHNCILKQELRRFDIRSMFSPKSPFQALFGAFYPHPAHQSALRAEWATHVLAPGQRGCSTVSLAIVLPPPAPRRRPSGPAGSGHEPTLPRWLLPDADTRIGKERTESDLDDRPLSIISMAPNRAILTAKTIRLSSLAAARPETIRSQSEAFQRQWLHDTDRGFGASFDSEAGATCGGWTRFRKPGAYNHTARHAVECAE